MIRPRCGATDRLNKTNIGPAFEQMGRETVSQRMQRHRLLDTGGFGSLVKQTTELPGGHRLA
jgi:hypothetical protein